MVKLEENWCLFCGTWEPVGPEGYGVGCAKLLPPHEVECLMTFANIIAMRHNTNELKTNQEKFEDEIKEFDRELNRPESEERNIKLLHESADLVYYAAKLQAEEINVVPKVESKLAQAHIYKWTAMSAALEKYHLRSQPGHSKDVEGLAKEYKAMRRLTKEMY